MCISHLETMSSSSFSLSQRLKTFQALSSIKSHIRRIHFSPKDTILNTSKLHTQSRAYALKTLKLVCWYDNLLRQLRIWLYDNYHFKYENADYWNDFQVMLQKQSEENEKIRQERKECKQEPTDKSTPDTQKNNANLSEEDSTIFTDDVNPLFLEFMLYALLIEKDEAFLNSLEEMFGNEEKSSDTTTSLAPNPSKNLLQTHWKWTHDLWNLRQKCEDKLRSIMKTEGKTSLEDFIPESLKGDGVVYPKYVRPNRHKGVTMQDLEQILLKAGLQKGSTLKDTKEKCAIGFKEHPLYFPDDLIPGLFVIPFDFPVHNLEETHSGRIIVQDKSSCVPPVVMVQTLKKLKYLNNPYQKIAIIDGCAAPGNKTSLLAELLLDFPNATVHAIEIDKRRCNMLKKRIKQFGAKNIVVHNADFLKLNFRSIKYLKAVMLDPSCSGSGMGGRDSFIDYDTEDRIEKLAAFQEKMLRHSLRQPNVEVVTYSTCSIHDRENELVMQNTQQQLEKDNKHFQFYPVCPTLKDNRGKSFSKDYPDETTRCIRFYASKDLCGGFFVGCFVKESALEHRDPKNIIWKNGRQPKKGKNSTNAKKRKRKALTESQLARKQRRLELQKELYGGAKDESSDSDSSS